jgi:hypothetical protein
VILEQLAAESLLVQFVFLDHRAHRSIHDEDALFKMSDDGMHGERNT